MIVAAVGATLLLAAFFGVALMLLTFDTIGEVLLPWVKVAAVLGAGCLVFGTIWMVAAS